MQVELFLLIISLLFFASIFTDKLSSRFGVPALLLFLAVGMAFGSDGLGIHFSSISLAETIGTVSLCVILFAGGMDTKFDTIRPVIREGLSLATLGVLLTCGITGIIIYFIMRKMQAAEEVSFAMALLMAATMSSTDAASVFSILRTRNIHLKHNLKPMLELESGSNDPMAYILTITLIGIVTAGSQPNWILLVLQIVWQIACGFAVGFGFGMFVDWLMKKTQIANDSLYPILILTACIFIFAATHFVGGNSYLAVYIGGLVIGNSKFPHKRITFNFFDGLSWLCQLTMFLVLGLLVEPHRLKDIAILGLIISAVMIFIARPISVFITLIPYKQLHIREKTFLSWVGLKGAVPIIFAILCMSKGVPNADLLFNITFFCTLVSLILQGTSLAGLANKLGLVVHTRKTAEHTHFDIDLPEEIREQTIEVCVTEDMAPPGTNLRDLGLPANSLVMLLRRREEYLVPKGQTEVLPGDYLLIVSEDEAARRQQKKDTWGEELIEHSIAVLKEMFEKLSVQVDKLYIRYKIYRQNKQ